MECDHHPMSHDGVQAMIIRVLMPCREINALAEGTSELSLEVTVER